MNKVELIKHLKTLFPADQFIVTGSTALVYLGLVPKGTDKDLDIILVKPSDPELNTAKLLQEGYPASTKPLEYEGNPTLKYIFEMEGVKVDIFVEQNKMATLMVENAFEIANAEWIFGKKKKCNRTKDWQQLFSIANSICTLSNFVKQMGGQA